MSWQEPHVRGEREKHGFVPVVVGPRGLGPAQGEQCEGEGGSQASCIAETLPDGLWPGFSTSLPGSLWTLPELGREWHTRQPGGARITALPALPAQGQAWLLLGVASSGHGFLPCGVTRESEAQYEEIGESKGFACQ